MGGPIQATIFKVELNPQAYISAMIKKNVKDEKMLTPLEYAQKIRSEKSGDTVEI